MLKLSFTFTSLVVALISLSGFVNAAAISPQESFINVDGPDLKSKFEEARKKALANSKATPYWAAYNFDVRPGIAVDPLGQEFTGYFNSGGGGGNSLVIGTSNGVAVETRNLGIFMLYDSVGDKPKRLEVYNLERRREYSGYPVYWLGRAGNEESLNLLRSLSASDQSSPLSERAILAISLHDDARVAGLLKEFASASLNPRVRSSSIFWLGQLGGETPFLTSLARNEQEDGKLRRTAIHAIGASRDRNALVALRELYAMNLPSDLRRGIIHAVADNADKAAAYDFLLKLARSDPEPDARRQAIHRLSESERETTFTDLEQLYAADQSVQLRRSILDAYSRLKSTKAADKLFEIARQSDNKEMRRHAIHLIGEKAGRRSLEALRQTVDGDATPGNDVQVQMQAVQAIGQRPPDEAIPLLIKIARTHESTLVRKRAIQRLGELEDERVLAFFSEILTK